MCNLKYNLVVLFSFIIFHAEAAEGDMKFLSVIDSVQYQSTVEKAILKKTGSYKVNTEQELLKWTEPSGIGLKKAVVLADGQARVMLGLKYTAENPTWIMRSAELRSVGNDLAKLLYYHIKFTPLSGSGISSSECLQVIVLLDGNVLSIESRD